MKKINIRKLAKHLKERRPDELKIGGKSYCYKCGELKGTELHIGRESKPEQEEIMVYYCDLTGAYHKRDNPSCGFEESCRQTNELKTECNQKFILTRAETC
jgi:hypothetical protein